MRRLALIAVVLLSVNCKDKARDQGGTASAGSGAAGSAAAGSATAGTGSAAAGSATAGTAGSAAAGSAAAGSAAAGSAAAGSAAVSDDAVAEMGSGSDGRGLYYGRELTDADLEGRTLRDLSLMRNTIYARAGHPFRKAWLRDYFTQQPWYQALDRDDDSRITPTDRANAKRIAAREAGFPRQAMVDAQAALAAKTGRTPAEDVELRLLAVQLGKSAAGPAGQAPATGNPLEEPDLLDRLLTVEQLADLSRRDLRILRNTVYARHGRQFKSALLQDWFDNKAWYTPDPDFQESDLTAIDRKNVRLIRSVEDSLGGPLTDREHQAEDGWWDAA